MSHYSPIVDVYYRPEMTAPPAEGNVSESPTKPKRFVEWLQRSPLAGAFQLLGDFGPLEREAFLVAHGAGYVDGFFTGRAPLAESNNLKWSRAFADTVRYTNGSLVAALRGACDHPDRLALSPTSGFHHAGPHGGAGFCTFSGQVIASVSLYRERALCGAWIDLDGHFGNSIGDSLDFVPDLAQAVPFNVNPKGAHDEYLRDLEAKLERVGAAVLAGTVHYIAFAHGADSHEDDDMHGQCSTDEWLAASRLVYGAIKRWSDTLGRPVPTALALFGGYRSDDYEFVLSLHGADLAVGLDVLAGTAFALRPG